METIVKAIKIGGIVNTIFGDILDPIIEVIEFIEENNTFLRKYSHEHPDETETDKINYEFKFPNSLTINTLKPSDKGNFEFIVKKKLQSREDEILFRNIYPQPEEAEILELMKSIIRQKYI